MSDVPVVILAGQSNAHFGGIDNRIVERLDASGNAFEFVKVAEPGAGLFTNAKIDFDPDSPGELFAELVDATKAAMANVIAQGDTPVVSFLFAHGETDAGRPSAIYAQKLTQFITAFREQIGAPDAAVYLSLLPRPTPGRTAQQQVAASVPNVYTIETNTLATWDGSHYDHAGRERIADEFVDRAGIVAPAIPGYDSLLAPTTITVANNEVTVEAALYEDLTFTGDDRRTFVNSYSGDDTITTGAGADIINSGDNDDRISAGAGNDYVNGGAGDDIIDGGDGDDQLNGFLGFDRIYGGAGNDRLNGYTEVDYLNGGAGNDTLDGGAGVDTMEGGIGNDTYYVDTPLDNVIELPGEGFDTVNASSSFDLDGQDLEVLRLSGNGHNYAYGNALANTLMGNSGNNRIDGRGGADTMIGGLGNDTYVVDNAGDIVTEVANGGTDTVEASVSYALSANVENLTLTGSAYSATGNALANVLTGTADANLLDGGAGADLMTGGAGDDVYSVDNAGDRVVELAGGGTDHVIASVSYSLVGRFVEMLTLTGTAANAIGNSQGNTLVGNDLANALKGGAGGDTMIGGKGDDIYYVDDVRDRIVEAGGEGIDAVFASITWSLGENVERLTLTGDDAINAIGNGLVNRLTGNDAGNRLAGEGGNDWLYGMGGNDSLRGGLGNDDLTGGAGADRFVFDTTLGPLNVDTIRDFDVVEDLLYLDDAIFAAAGPVGRLAADAFHIGAAAADDRDRVIYDDATGLLSYDPDGSGAQAAVAFAKLTPGTALTAADVFIF